MFFFCGHQVLKGYRQENKGLKFLILYYYSKGSHFSFSANFAPTSSNKSLSICYELSCLIGFVKFFNLKVKCKNKFWYKKTATNYFGSFR